MPLTKTFTPDDVSEPVKRLFNTLALQLIHRGFARYSAYAIMHQMRWHYDVEVTDPEQQYKICNGYGPALAREFHKRFPQHDGFFRTKHAPRSYPGEDEKKED